ncbi:MAG TPA: tol-pal system protein YbgF [Sulfurihydrogenibium sp.]|uniref:tol-pal system protein YbgF n=1 Tax=Sulfurihydrogenibium sp. (strain YO3AOP1) TaxID=436114 RepID=UPI0001724A36|nr:tol-pal system protein YbgF [Sulfurihydrogenibium sp. YO3AOP1]ACD66277.1 tol-pal system protein YbgF [Sulfurihydrogenibium sp. YO3AOP1]HBT97978.1 tol-pal system protein YbgF [Sulfurihydrogenibium sp.]
MKKILFLGFSSIFLFSCASEDKITTLQRELLSLRQEVNELKDRTNDNTENIKNINARLDKLSQKVAENSADIEKLKMGRQTYASSPTPPQEVKKEGKEEVAVPQNDKQLYQYALDLYFKGNIEESRKAFTEFLKKYPDSDLYGNAIFWAGQTFYAEKKYKDAIDIWEIFLKKCDEGKIKKCNKYPDAMLKLGYSYIELGNEEKGKQYLQDLIKKYPDSEPASLAKKKLEVLK